MRTVSDVPNAELLDRSPAGSGDHVYTVRASTKDGPTFEVNYNHRLNYVGVSEIVRQGSKERKWVNRFFAQGEEADYFVGLIENEGEVKLVDYLADAGFLDVT